MLASGLHDADRSVDRLFAPDVRWVARQEGAGSQRFLREIIAEHRLDPADRRVTARAYTERDAASAIATGQADVAPGVRAAAGEFGLEFVSVGWEAFDLAMSRGIYFRTLFRGLLDALRGPECQRLAQVFGGYDFTDLGKVVWSA
jgi:molybdate-binding protein